MRRSPPPRRAWRGWHCLLRVSPLSRETLPARASASSAREPEPTRPPRVVRAGTYSRYNVRVNVVSPGLTDTGIAARITGNEAALKASLAMHPLGKLGAPADVADAIFFMCVPSGSPPHHDSPSPFCAALDGEGW